MGIWILYLNLEGIDSSQLRCRGRRAQSSAFSQKARKVSVDLVFVSRPSGSHAAVEPVPECGRLLSQTPMLRHAELVAQPGLLTSPCATLDDQTASRIYLDREGAEREPMDLSGLGPRKRGRLTGDRILVHAGPKRRRGKAVLVLRPELVVPQRPASALRAPRYKGDAAPQSFGTKHTPPPRASLPWKILSRKELPTSPFRPCRPALGRVPC